MTSTDGGTSPPELIDATVANATGLARHDLARTRILTTRPGSA